MSRPTSAPRRAFIEVQWTALSSARALQSRRAKRERSDVSTGTIIYPRSQKKRLSPVESGPPKPSIWLGGASSTRAGAFQDITCPGTAPTFLTGA